LDVSVAVLAKWLHETKQRTKEEGKGQNGRSTKGTKARSQAEADDSIARRLGALRKTEDVRRSETNGLPTPENPQRTHI